MSNPSRSLAPAASPRLIAAGVALGLLAGCSDELILPGERFPVRPPDILEDVVDPAPDLALALPAARANTDWTHRNGTASGRPDHPALRDQPERVWSVSIGSGNARRARLITAPIVGGGLVYAMDSGGRLTAVDPSGRTVWSTSLVPAGEQPSAGTGGGLAFAGGRLFATTGFGEVRAIDPATGGTIWVQQLEGPARAAPTVADGRVYVVARNDTAYGLDAATGTFLWRVRGAGGQAGPLGGASIAAEEPVVVVPFASGEVQGVLARNGLQLWTTAVTGGRRGQVRARISDISGDPVLDGERVYASNQAGRTVALDRRTGERLWTLPEGSFGPAWPVAGAVFFLSDEGVLIRVAADTGLIQWQAELPGFTERRRGRERVYIPHFGPMLAGGILWVASGDGFLRGFDPVSGSPVRSLEIPGGAAAAPAVAQGTLYVVSADGRLHAYR